MKASRIVVPFFVSVVLMAGSVYAADQDRDRDQMRDQDKTQLKTQDKDRDRTPIYGSQLMTKQERMEYRTRMRNAKTKEEREQIRKEHHEQMKLRAKEKGVTLPDEPPAQGMGAGKGMGQGMGQGQGMGAGKNR